MTTTTHVNVRDHGAMGDGITDDTTAIHAAAATLPQGGTLHFPPGKYYVTGTITLEVTCSVSGQAVGAYAGGELHGSVIFNKMGTASPFASSGDGVWFRDLFFISYQDPRTVHDNQCTAITFTDGENCGIERCVFSGWYQWVDFQNCAQFTLRDNHFSLASRYGVLVRNLAAPDNGDSVVTGNMFVSNDPWNPDALIRQESSGGLRVFGNKFLATTNGAARFLDVAISDGVETSILLVTGNSFEFPRTSAIRVTTQGPRHTGKFSRVNITGNQFSGNRVSDAVIDVGHQGNPLDVAEISITGNTMWGHRTYPGGGFVRLRGVNNVNVSANSFRGGPLGVDVKPGAYNVMVDQSNLFHEVATRVRGNTVPGGTQLPPGALLEIDAPRPPKPTITAQAGGAPRVYAVAYRDGSSLVGQLSDTVTAAGAATITWPSWPTHSTIARVYRGIPGELTEYQDVTGNTFVDGDTGWVAGTHPGASTYPAVRLGSKLEDPLGGGGRPTGWLMGGAWGINTRFPTSDFHVNGSQSVRVDKIQHGAGDYTVTDNAHTVLIAALTADRTIRLPRATTARGRELTIKDTSGCAGPHVITVAPSTPGETVDGAPGKPINTAYGALRLISDGTNWFTV